MRKALIFGLVLLNINTIFAFNKIKVMNDYYQSGNLGKLQTCLDTIKVFNKSEVAAKLYYSDILNNTNANYQKLSTIYQKTNFGQKAILLEGKKYFLKRDYKKSIKEFSRLSKDFSSKKNYWLAISFFKDSQWWKAIIYAQKYIAFAEKSAKKDQCYLIIANSYQNLKFYDKAINTFKFIKKNVFDIHFIPEITYQLGLCYELKGDNLSALDQYSIIVNNYSYSPFFLKTENRLSKSDKKKIMESPNPKDIVDSPIVASKKENQKSQKKIVKSSSEFFIKGKYYIQAGAYSNKKYAELQKKKILKLGIKSTIKTKKYGKKELLTVSLGPFNSKKNALEITKKLKQNKIKAYIYKL